MTISLKKKLIVIPLVSALVVYLVSFSYIVVRLKQKNVKDAELIVNQQAKQNVNKIETMLTSYLSQVKGIGHSFEQLSELPIDIKKSVINQSLLSLIQSNEHYVGAWSSWQLNHFDTNWGDNPGRVSFISLRNGKEIISYTDSLDIGGVTRLTGYHKVMKSKKETIMEPYLELKLNKMETTLAVPILNNNEFQGLVGIDIDFDEFTKLLSQFTIYENGYTFLISHKGLYVYHPDTSVIAKSFAEINPYEDSLYQISKHIEQGKPISFYATHTDTGDDVYAAFQPLYIGNTNTPWSMGVLVNMNKVRAESDSIIRNTIIVGIIGFISIFIILVLVSNNILHSIRRIMNFADQISNGIIGKELNIKENDEIGNLGMSLNNLSNQFHEIVINLKQSSASIDTFEKKLSASIQDFMTLAQQQQDASGNVTTAISDIAENIRNATDNASRTKLITNDAAIKLVSGSNLTQETKESVMAISKVISEIVEIANKTDMLAINASIEANRAGEQGKGFAVVANEVRMLAERSQKAAAKIKDSAHNSAHISDNSGKIIEELVPDMQRIVVLIDEIDALSLEQNLSIEKIREAMLELSALSSKNSNFADELNFMIQEFKEISSTLKVLVSYFKMAK